MADLNNISGLGTFHLSDTNRKWQPGKGNFFELIVSDLDQLLKPGLTEDSAREDKYITNGSDVLRLTVKTFKVPSFEISDIEVVKGNSTVHYAGTPKFQSGSLTIEDMIGPESKAVLEAWHNLAYDVMTDKGGRAINYKKDCTVIEYTADHVKVRSWKLIGCYLTTVEESDYDKTADDLREVSATLIYDRAIPTLESQADFTD